MDSVYHKTRIFLLDDCRLMRDGLRALFERCADVHVVGEGDGRDLPPTDLLEPDVVIVGIEKTCQNPVATVEGVLRQWPRAKVLALSAKFNSVLARELLRAGTRGHVSLECTFDELLKGIGSVAAGETYLCPRTMEALLDSCAPRGCEPADPLGAVLTDREQTVLHLLAEGQTSKQIGAALGLSSKTIDACRRQLMEKLEVDSVAGLVRHALLLEVATAAPSWS